MTPKQFRVVIVLLVGLIAGQWIQTALQMRSAARVERAADSAEVSGIDAVDLSKDILRTQKARASEESVPLDPCSGPQGE